MNERGPRDDPTRWRAIRLLVDAALELPAASRDAFLASADETLRDDAARWLAACGRAESAVDFLARPAAERAAALFDSRPLHSDESIASLRRVLEGNYRVERELGRGGMARVYLARDVRHDRDVAIKVVRAELATTIGSGRFLSEIRTTAHLQHPHILPLFDSGSADGRLYYVMPYVAGETLRARIARDGALPLGDAIRLLRELADALAYAHSRGVMHRDLKPENVLLSGGHAVVADFGIAKAFAAAADTGDGSAVNFTTGGAMLGTPAYMAPEQASGRDDSDHRVDLYALGVIAYEMIAGSHPFGVLAPHAFIAAHLTDTPPPLSDRRLDTPPALVSLVTALLAKNPAERPQAADDVLRALDEISGSAPSRVASVSLPREQKPALRSRTVVVGAGFLALLVVLGGYANARGVFSLGRSSGTRTRGDSGNVGGSARSTERSASAIRTVAVLPFANISGVASDDYFSDGMTDELANALARIPGLRLAGRSSSYVFKGRAVPAQEIGRALDVGAIVGGTVRRSGNRLRVTTQLVSTVDGKVLWDSVNESQSNDVFVVQDEFTRAIVAALAPSLGDGSPSTSSFDASRGTTSQEAYDLYLKGRYLWLQRGANVPRAIGFFRRAVDVDPSFARAHAGLAFAYSTLPDFEPDPDDSATVLTRRSAHRAIALDSTLADAQLAMGVALEVGLDLPGAEPRYRAALAIDPSSVSAHHWLGLLLLNRGRVDEALAELRRATELDPLATAPASALALALTFARRFPEARSAAHRALTLDSAFVFAIWPLGLAQTFGDQPDSAIRTFERGARLNPGDSRMLAGLVLANAAAGRWSDAARIRAQLHRPGGDRSGWADAAVADLVFGDREPYIRALTTNSTQRRYYAAGAMLGCNPLLDPLWSDARFSAAMLALTIEPCPIARPWPAELRSGGQRR